MNTEVRTAYKKAVSMRFEESRMLIAELKRTQPDNLMTLFVENYVDFLQSFIDEHKGDYKSRLKKVDNRLWKISKGDNTSPYYLYTQAEIRLQWAILRGKFGQYLTAINEVKQAYALLEQNQKKFPDFIPNKRSLGIMHALVGNVPEEYRWAVKMFGGMDGTIQQGLGEIEEVIDYAEANPKFAFAEESLVAYSFLLLHLGNKSDKAWKKLNNGTLRPKENPLAAFAIASLAMRTGRNTKAIEVLQQAPSGKGIHPFHFKNFLLGIAKLERLDKDANRYLEAFIKNHTGNYGIKEAYQKLAWYHLINGNPAGYSKYIQFCKTEGSDRFEPDKAAEREAKSGEIPDVLLTKARLLFDGGYNQRAYDLLLEKADNYAPNTKNSIDYYYRLGRISHGLKKYNEAAKFYQKTIEAGRNKPWYFACNAALQLGLIREQQGNTSAAKDAYKTCLAIDPEEYASSLHAKAKAGLNRL